jgi:hypothetical protein
MQGTGGLQVAKEIFLANYSWKQATTAALSDVFEPWTSRHAALLWHWWTTEPLLVSPSSVLLPKGIDSAEGDMVSAMPTIVSREVREPVLASARDFGWFMLHSAVLAAAADLTTVEKLRFQIEAEPDPQALSGLELLVSKVDPTEMFAAALEIGDPRLLDFAGRAAARVPVLIAHIDASTFAWRAIWLSYIQAGRRPFDGIAQPSQVSHALMDAVLAGSSVPAQLVEFVACHPQSDLAAYAKRRDLWRKLPPPIATRALLITAERWLARFLVEPQFDQLELEPELQDAVLARWRSSPALATAASLYSLWDRFSGLLSEADFLAWIAADRKRTTTLEARAIGQLVRQHGWARVADELAKLLRNGRNDLAAAVHECSSLLGRWDRFRVTLFTTNPVITVDEWWDAWLDLSNRLYPLGIQENNIWTDAAGDVSRIRHGTGREEWGQALDLLRKGGAGGEMTIEGLLHEMREDFRGNSDLQLMENIYLNQLRRA